MIGTGMFLSFLNKHKGKIFSYTLITIVIVVIMIMWRNNYIHKQNEATLENSISQQTFTINKLEKALSYQKQSLQKVYSENRNLNKELFNKNIELNKYRNRLGKLALAKPGLIEKKVNDATKDLLDNFGK